MKKGIEREAVSVSCEPQERQPLMEFHISRKTRDKYGVNDLLFSYSGNVVFANIAASRELTNRVNAVRGTAEPAKVMHAGSLFAMGLIDELSHALIARYRKTLDPKVLAEGIRWFETQSTPTDVGNLISRFTQYFPNIEIYRGRQTVEQWLQGSHDGVANREIAFEELLLLWLSNINPAFAPFKEFFDDTDLQQQTIYRGVTTRLDDYFITRPRLAPKIGTLLDALRAPMLASPDSLTGQLAYIRDNWAPYLDLDLRQVLLAMDILKEEEIAIWILFHPPSESAWHPHREPGRNDEGFEGDEFVGYGGIRRKRGSGNGSVLHEYEAFSPDQAWMPTVVLIAKSTYVWLEQLSKKYKRHIHRLDHIPDEELAILADRGLNGLWLIGLWERSKASQTIKRLRGQWDAVASAYSLADYRIADDLGGEPAYRHLRDRAAAHGIRLASDMVPNHMGIDSTWVMQHPEWFLSRPDSPYPSYSFNGPDLSDDSNVEIKIEDHYFDQTDAAVVFRRRVRSTDHTEYIYHGNDGTTFAWNDTAQLNYSKAEVREQVMQTILAVARLFPIIRFDAAMTLAKKHVQRLWFPLPGVGGSIPSRAESSMSQEEFDALMPNEFWREVVDRVAVEVPGTLLLAEAFWLLEGYFVRTLGMHRVYNSAFMNMLRDEENAKYRSYLKKTIEFDPDILKRYVNFMSNPDERTAIDQFGTGDRYFGVCTMLATLPGLPMFGHGQIEAFTEKYGMEYKQARMDETPNEDLVARHQREIAPLLKRRYLFAESSNFVLYDFWTESGTVDENVFAYSNFLDGERAIVFFNNRYNETRGTIHHCAEYMDKGSGSLRSRPLRDALQLPSEDDIIIAFRDISSGLEYLRHSRSLDDNGLTLALHAFQYRVLLDWHELRPSQQMPWDVLCDSLNGIGVPSLDEAMTSLRLRPLHNVLAQALSPTSIQEWMKSVQEKRTEEKSVPLDVVKKSAEPVAVVEKEEDTSLLRVTTLLTSAENFFKLAHEFEPVGRTAHLPLQEIEKTLQDLSSLTSLKLPNDSAAHKILPMKPPASASTALWTQVIAWALLRNLTAESIAAPARFDRLQLRLALADSLRSAGFEGEGAWRAAARIRLLLELRPAGASLLRVVQEPSFWSNPEVFWLIGANLYRGKTYFNKELFEELVFWLALPDLIQPESHTTEAPWITLFAQASTAGYEVESLLTLLQEPAKSTTPVTPKTAPAQNQNKEKDKSSSELLEAEVKR